MDHSSGPDPQHETNASSTILVVRGEIRRRRRQRVRSPCSPGQHRRGMYITVSRLVRPTVWAPRSPGRQARASSLVARCRGWRRYLRGGRDNLIHRAICWACHAHSRAFPASARSGSDRNRTLRVRRRRHGLHHAGIRAAARRRDLSARGGGLGSRRTGLHLVVSSPSGRVRERTPRWSPPCSTRYERNRASLASQRAPSSAIHSAASLSWTGSRCRE